MIFIFYHIILRNSKDFYICLQFNIYFYPVKTQYVLTRTTFTFRIMIFWHTYLMIKSKSNKISFLLKILTAFCSVGGVSISLINAKKDGISHWSKRLLYFTAQSNIWIGLTVLLIIFGILLKFSPKVMEKLYILKYIFTVSITVTAIVFFFFLAPFADKSYHIWTFSGFLTHLFSPLFAITDYFIDKNKIAFNKKSVLYSIIPPLIYVLGCFLLTSLNVDFGRGENFPYFFMNILSPAGFFGFSNRPPILGSFYWITVLSLITLLLGLFYKKTKLHTK